MRLKCINNRERVREREGGRESGESDRKKPKQRHSAGQSTCSCSPLIGQRLSLFVAGKKRERESKARERIMCALLAALRESHRMYCKTCLCWTPCIRALVILAHRLWDDADADDTTRFSCCSAFFVCSRGVYATVRRFFWTVHALRKLKLKFGNPNNEHIRTQPSQAVKILIPLPFQDSVNRKSDRTIPKVATWVVKSTIYAKFVCDACILCPLLVSRPLANPFVLKVTVP